MELTAIYRGILQSIGLEVDDKGYVSFKIEDHNEPYLISKKRLVVPEYEILKNPDWKNNIAFHPMCENIVRQDSVVFKNLQSMINVSVDQTVGFLVSQIIDVCADKDRHKSLNHIQSAVLEHFPDADKTSFANWNKIEKVIGKENRYITFTTLRSRELNGEKFPRVCNVGFEIIKALETAVETNTPVVYGVKLRKKDMNGFLNIFRFIFKKPLIEYSTGIRDMDAPSFNALIRSYAKVNNDIAKAYRSLDLPFESTEWSKHLDKMVTLKGMIPALPYNEGDVLEGHTNQPAATAPPAQVVTPRNFSTLSNSGKPLPDVVSQPIQTPVVAPAVATQQAVVHPTPVYQQPVQQQMVQQPAMQQQANIQPEVVERNGRKYIKQNALSQPATPMYQQPAMVQQPVMQQAFAYQQPPQPEYVIDSNGYAVPVRPQVQQTTPLRAGGMTYGQQQPQMMNQPLRAGGYQQQPVYGQSFNRPMYGQQQSNSHYTNPYTASPAPMGMMGNEMIRSPYNR